MPIRKESVEVTLMEIDPVTPGDADLICAMVYRRGDQLVAYHREDDRDRKSVV